MNNLFQKNIFFSLFISTISIWNTNAFAISKEKCIDKLKVTKKEILTQKDSDSELKVSLVDQFIYYTDQYYENRNIRDFAIQSINRMIKNERKKIKIQKELDPEKSTETSERIISKLETIKDKIKSSTLKNENLMHFIAMEIQNFNKEKSQTSIPTNTHLNVADYENDFESKSVSNVSLEEAGDHLNQVEVIKEMNDSIANQSLY